jgi:hypothetical protein
MPKKLGTYFDTSLFIQKIRTNGIPKFKVGTLRSSLCQNFKSKKVLLNCAKAGRGGLAATHREYGARA